jgi:hypothetical protein
MREHSRSRSCRPSGKSRAKNTAKIHLVVCSYGLTVEFEVIGRNVSDRSVAPELIAKLPDAQAMVANKG